MIIGSVQLTVTAGSTTLQLVFLGESDRISFEETVIGTVKYTQYKIQLQTNPLAVHTK